MNFKKKLAEYLLIGALFTTPINNQSSLANLPIKYMNDRIYNALEMKCDNTLENRMYMNIGDFDNDGDNEIVFATRNRIYIQEPVKEKVKKKDLIPTFYNFERIEIKNQKEGKERDLSIVCGDVDQDGDLDVILGNEKRIIIYKNETFQDKKK